MSGTAGIGGMAPRRPSLVLAIVMSLTVPAMLAAASAWLGSEYTKTEAMRLEAGQAFNRRAEADNLIARVTDAETAQRGYVLVGDAKFLVSYDRARTDVDRMLQTIADEFRGAPAEMTLLAQLNDLKRQKFDEMNSVISTRRLQGLAVAARQIGQGRGQRLMEEMRSVSAKIMRAAGASRHGANRAYVDRLELDRFWIWIGIAVAGIVSLAGAAIIWLQARARYHARLAAYAAAERNRAVLDSTTDALVLIDPNGKIESINAAASATFGFASAELHQRDVSVLIPALDPSAVLSDRIGRSDGKLAKALFPDHVARHKDGHEIPVDIALGVMTRADGNHIVASVRDISERKRVERVKDDLMSTVSHELRTPLTSVVGALGLLRAGSAGDVPAAAQRLIEIAENNSRRLIRLINDMLDIDRLKSGRLEIQRAPIDLSEVVARACEGSRGLADAAGVEIVCNDIKPAARVSGDADRLLQVVSNLVSNAVRISSRGSAITIGVIADHLHGHVRVTIDDRGPGVPAEFRDRIFGRFERAEGEQGAGTGLGLAISREIIARHDGRIWFEDLADGTRFAFQLDMLREEAADNLAAGAPAAAKDRPIVLHLDDDQDMLDVVASTFASQILICKATNLERARHIIATERLSAAIVDVDLANGASGLELLPLLVGSGHRRIPTIIFSAHDVDAATAARVDAVLVKSRGSLPDLKAAIFRLVDTSSRAA